MSEEDPFEKMCGFDVEASEAETFDGYPQSLIALAGLEFEVLMVARDGNVLSGVELCTEDGPIGVVDGSHTDLTYISLIRMHEITTKANVEPAPEDTPESPKPKLSVYLPTHAEIEAQVLAAIARGDAC